VLIEWPKTQRIASKRDSQKYAMEQTDSEIFRRLKNERNRMSLSGNVIITRMKLNALIGQVLES
jgi:phage-related protein